MNKKKFVSTVTAVLLLLVLTSVAFASPGALEVTVPFRGSIEGSEVYQVDLVNMTMFVQAEGWGTASHLGNYTVSYEGTVNLITGLAPEVTAVFVAANGDLLYATAQGQGTPMELPNLHNVIEDYTVTGGTGRFANASGSFRMDRIVNTDTGETSGGFAGSLVLSKGK